METRKPLRVIISGGGTGGHVYPALAIANEIMAQRPDTKILFVGAEDKMEMKVVPKAGFDIVGLPITGIQRKLTADNLAFPFKLVKSLVKARAVLKKFKPDVVVGVGGFASGPLLYAATARRIPALIQEQNSYAGLTNKWLRDRVEKICVAYDGMERYFPKSKILFTGNPIRLDVARAAEKQQEAMDFFGFDATKPTLLVMGGSLGARMINESVMQHIDTLIGSEVQLIWQTGKIYYQEMQNRLINHDKTNLRILEFIDRMDLAYAAADLVISRAGALSVSELCLVGKAAIFVPSPNVAEDHQTKNAMALVNVGAAAMVKDEDAPKKMIPEALKLITDERKREEFETKIKTLARPRATKDIVATLFEIIEQKKK
jgi:UDP-N-acetylglucosamine--N-acetylmuramyl-(pentapeptide) pyrophosphoryl-undecaprenol N-acetylglucosamine transferase